MPLTKALKDIIINNFQRGIADSPMLGFADMRNVDIWSTPGVVKIQFLPTKVSSTTVTALIKWFAKDPSSGKIFGLDESGNVYKTSDTSGDATWTLVTGNTLTNGHGEGLAVWKDYLFVARNATLDVMKISDDTWSTGWMALNADGSNFHPIIAGADDILYIGNGRYISSVQENAAPFVPGTAGSYIQTAAALTLPQNYKVKSLAELGKYLMIGTWQGGSLYEQKTADIFPWDRSSTSFNLPLRIAENGINQMVTIENILYIHAGTRGRIYQSNGVSVQEVRRLYNLIYAFSEWLSPFPGAMCFHDGKLMIGLAQGGGNPYPMGVFSLRNKALAFENVPSHLNYGSVTADKIGAILSTGNDYYLIGWKDDSTFGIDLVGKNGYRYTSYAAYIDSQLFQVGTYLLPRTFQQLEITLDKPLASGQGVRVSYRKNLSDSFTVIATFDYATYGAIQSYMFDAGMITDAVEVQFRTELTTGSSSTTTPELREVRAR